MAWQVPRRGGKGRSAAVQGEGGISSIDATERVEDISATEGACLVSSCICTARRGARRVG